MGLEKTIDNTRATAYTPAAPAGDSVRRLHRQLRFARGGQGAPQIDSKL